MVRFRMPETVERLMVYERNGTVILEDRNVANGEKPIWFEMTADEARALGRDLLEVARLVGEVHDG